MGILIGLLVCALIAAAVSAVASSFSPERREIRSDNRTSRKALASKTRQLQIAKSALVKIAADDSGNPALDAKVALGDISTDELKELES